MALHEDRGLRRVDAKRQELSERRERSLTQKRRVITTGNCVLIDYAVERVVGVLQLNPLAQRAQPIT